MGYFQVHYQKASDDKGFVPFKSLHDWPTASVTMTCDPPLEACQVCWTDICHVNMNFTWHRHVLPVHNILPPNASETKDLSPQMWIWRAENTIFDRWGSRCGQYRAQEHQEGEQDAEAEYMDQGTRKLGITSHHWNSRFV